VCADPSRVLIHLHELRALTGDQDGAQRVAFTPMWRKARDWFTAALADLPVVRHTDSAGNAWATLQGVSDRSLIVGSHLDSVPDGGWLDGALGVTAGIEILRSLAARYNNLPPFTIRLVDWADEEGVRFGRSLFGSSAFAGSALTDADRLRCDSDGIFLSDALAENGIDLLRIGEAKDALQNAAAYIELHIEQGPVLERLGLPLGAVTGTMGAERHRIVFQGQQAHAGATPMIDRRDALTPAARLALELRQIAARYPGAVCTMGSVTTHPGIATAIVGRCEVTLDQRALDAGDLAAIVEEAKQVSRHFAEEERCTVEWSSIWRMEPVAFDPTLIALCDEAIRETVRNSHRLPSGALHDATELARAGVPTAMLFVQSLGGISHNKIEDTSRDDLTQAVVAFDRLAAKVLRWMEQV